MQVIMITWVIIDCHIQCQDVKVWLQYQFYHRADGEATIGQLSAFVSFGNLSKYHSK